MREILFRMYDDVKMVYDGLVIYNGELYEDWRAFEDGIKSDNPLMQYTGLDDKNGVKIFEGDIHEYGGRHFTVKFGYYTDDDTHVEMYGWYFDSNSLEEQGSLGVDSEKYVNIIGNIHDNPEVTE